MSRRRTHRRALALRACTSRTADWPRARTIRRRCPSPKTRGEGGPRAEQLLVLARSRSMTRASRCSKRRFATLPDAPRSSPSSAAGSPGRTFPRRIRRGRRRRATRGRARASARRRRSGGRVPFDPRDAGDARRRTRSTGQRGARIPRRDEVRRSGAHARGDRVARDPPTRTRDGSATRASGSSSCMPTGGSETKGGPLPVVVARLDRVVERSLGVAPPSGRQMRATSASSTAGRGARTSSRRRGSPSTGGGSSRRAPRRCTASSCPMSRSGSGRRSCCRRRSGGSLERRPSDGSGDPREGRRRRRFARLGQGKLATVDCRLRRGAARARACRRGSGPGRRVGGGGTSRHRPHVLAAVTRCRGLAAAADGKVGEAVSLLEDAVSEHVVVGDVVGRSRSLLALGAARRRLRQKRAAREALDAALAGFEELGARRGPS